jgi:tRNA modification GTPase
MTAAGSEDVIVAVASAVGGAARGIVRLSGATVARVLEPVFHDAGPPLSECRRPTCRDGHVRLVSLGLDLPGTLYFWPTERSYTRQPMAEWHTIGSPPLLQAALREFCAAGARLAEPGEFTLRAFLAGRIDLTQAEAVLGVIQARGESQLDTALKQLAGGLRGPLDAIRGDLLDLLAELEAGLDFVEEDIEFISLEALSRRLALAAEAVTRIAAQAVSRTTTSDFAQVVLVGEPNVGKSSLFNRLCEAAGLAHRAIVSDVAGTTRDVLIARGRWQDMPIELVDTAGRESVVDPLGQAAQTQGSLRQSQADLVLLCLDASRERTAWERQQLAELDADRTLIVLTKADRATSVAPLDLPDAVARVAASAIGEPGISALVERMAEQLARSSATHGDLLVGSTATRCRASLAAASEALERARDLARRAGHEELIAAEVRSALAELGKVVGAVYTDDVLDRIFSRFCIGK